MLLGCYGMVWICGMVWSVGWCGLWDGVEMWQTVLCRNKEEVGLGLGLIMDVTKR